MASIFERLMTEGTALTESANVRRKKTTECKKINPKRIKVESRRIFEETDFTELDGQFAGDPTDEENDEVVLVIDPEIPADEEVPEDAAEEMIGDAVYKCPVCGSNYVCDCDALGEDINVDEDGVPTECPICGDDADQILVGEIAPIEDAGDEDTLDPVDADDAAGADDEGEGEEGEGEGEDAPAEDDEEIIEEEGLKLTESDEIAGGDEDVAEGEADLVVDIADEDEAEVLVLEPDVADEDADAPVIEINDSEVNLVLDDARLEAMMTRVIRENYKGAAKFSITRAALRSGKLRLEYAVRSGKKVTKGVLVGEGFDKTARAMKIRFVDKGVFTEAFAKTPSFIVECVRLRSVVTPVSVKYDYKVKVNESLYRIHGKVGK